MDGGGAGREIQIYGFPPLVWAILVTFESELFSSIGIPKGAVVMNLFWISVFLLLAGLSGWIGDEAERVLRRISVGYGLGGLLFLGLIGYYLRWW